MKIRILTRKLGISVFLMCISILTIEAQIPLEFLQKNANDAQARYDQGYELALQVNEKIKTAIAQTNDKQLISELNPLQKELVAIRDYGANLNRIKRIATDVNIAISNYTNRVSLKQEQTLVDHNQPSVSSQKSQEELIQEYWTALQNDIALKRYEIAAQNCSKIIELVPDNPELFWLRGQLYSELKKYPLAIKDFTDFLSYMSKDSIDRIAVAYYSRAYCKSLLSDHFGALDDYQKSATFIKNSSLIYNQIAWEKLLLKRYSEALVDADKAVNCDNTDYNALDTRAEIKLNLKDYKGCLADCEEVFKLNEYPNTFLIKGRALYELGDKENACKNWSKAGELGKSEAYDYISKYCK